ncbi:MAG: methylglyoxal synthase [Bacteroidota bacterium]
MKNIAVIAHDAKKTVLAQFVETHRTWILGVKIIATGRTAEYLEEQNIEVKHLMRGREGGYRQITDMLIRKEIDLLVFFIDPDITEPHHPDIGKLLDTCDRHNIPLATNYSSAELIIIGLIKKDEAEKTMRRLKGN